MRWIFCAQLFIALNCCQTSKSKTSTSEASTIFHHHSTIWFIHLTKVGNRGTKNSQRRGGASMTSALEQQQRVRRMKWMTDALSRTAHMFTLYWDAMVFTVWTPPLLHSQQKDVYLQAIPLLLQSLRLGHSSHILRATRGPRCWISLDILRHAAETPYPHSENRTAMWCV